MLWNTAEYNGTDADCLVRWSVPVSLEWIMPQQVFRQESLPESDAESRITDITHTNLDPM